MNDRNNLTEGSIRKKMLLFAIPIFIGQVFQQLYNTFDSLIVGRYLAIRPWLRSAPPEA